MELSSPGVDRTLMYLDVLLAKYSYEKQFLLHIYKKNTNFPIFSFTIMSGEGDIKTPRATCQ